MYFFVELDGGLVRTRLPEPPVRGIAHDREQPRAGIAAAEPVGILMRSQVRLLHHVLRVFPAAHQPSRQVIGGIEMWQKEFGYPMAQFNPRGGAIAVGHPLGASGVALMTRLLRHLEATGGRYGFQTMCEGGGQANATVIERLA